MEPEPTAPKTTSAEPGAPETGPPKAGLVLNPKKPKPKRSLRYRVGRATFVVLGVLCGLVGVAALGLHSSAGQEALRGAVERRLGARVDGTATLETLRLTLFGPVEAGGLVLSDAEGTEVISVGKAHVELGWWAILSGQSIDVETFRAEDLTVHIRKRADGTSNLSTLFKSTAKTSDAPKRPFEKTIRVGRLSITNVNVRIDAPDGGVTEVRGLTTEGTLSATPSKKSILVELRPIEFSLTAERPKDQGKLSIGAHDVRTGLKLDLVEGAGKVTLDGLLATLAIGLPTGKPHSFPISWGAVSFDIADGNVGASLEELALGALDVAELDVRSEWADGSPQGLPNGDVLGLLVRADRVNELLGRSVLRNNVQLEAHVDSTASAPSGTLKLRSGSAKAEAKLALFPGPDGPTHDLELSIVDLKSRELLGEDVAVPPLEIGRISLSAKGRGEDATSLETEAHLAVKDTSIRGVPIDRIEAEVSIHGPDIELREGNIEGLEQHLSLGGRYNRETKAVSAELGADGDVGALLASLKRAGIPLGSTLPSHVVVLPKSDLRVSLEGTVGGPLSVTSKASALRVFGATASLDTTIDLAPEGGALKVQRFGGTSQVFGLRLGEVLALRGKPLPPGLGIDATANLTIRAEGTPTDPQLRAHLSAKSQRSDRGPTASLILDATQLGDRLDITAELARDGNSPCRAGDCTKSPLMRLVGSAPVTLRGEKKGLIEDGPFGLDLTIDDRPLAEFLELVPPPLLAGREIPQGRVGLQAKLTGTTARPRASIDLHLAASALDPGQPDLQQRVDAKATLAPTSQGKSRFDLTFSGGLTADGPDLVRGELHADLPRSALKGGVKDATFEGSVALPDLVLESLPATPKLDRLRALGGRAEGRVTFSGGKGDLRAHATASAEGLRPNDRGPIGAKIDVNLADTETRVAIDTSLNRQPLVALGGSIGLAGKGLLKKSAAERRAPLALMLDLDVPERPLKSLTPLAPGLASADGLLTGHFAIRGDTSRPSAGGELLLRDFATWNDGQGELKLASNVSAEGLDLELKVGPKGSERPVRLVAKGDAETVQALRTKGPMDLSVELLADRVDLRSVVPKWVLGASTLAPEATLLSDLALDVSLSKGEAKTEVSSAALRGALELSGSLPLPGTKRVYRDVTLKLRGSGSDLTLERLEAHETDPEVPDRKLEAEGSVQLAELKPTSAKLHVKTDRFLVFGAKPLGQLDAPRGAATLDISVAAELDRAVRHITVDVDHLELVVPDRFERAHQPEEVHAGDVLTLGGGQALGKLPVPESKKPRGPVPAPSDAAYDIEVHIAKGARIFQAPIDFHVGGDLNIAIRPEGRTLTGLLSMSDGLLYLGGKTHPLAAGSFAIDASHPTGNLDLLFERQMPPWSLHDVSRVGSTPRLRVHVFGPLSDRKNTFGGVAPGALYDALGITNEGRPRFVVGPDLPRAETADFPGMQGVLALTFISVNLPHLLFLDKIASWADARDDLHGYGRYQQFLAERYFREGSLRLQLTKDAPEAFASDAKASFDYLFENRPGWVFGAGVSAGSRGSAGAGLTMEWSSDD